MVFSDPAFLFYFLPVALVSYWAGGWRWRNAYLLAVSVVFYVSGGGSLVFLVLATAGFTYVSGLLVERHRGSSLGRRTAAVTIGLLLASLVIWKYLGFVVGQVSALLERMGQQSSVTVSLVLPIAISFYTFQCVSYVVDVRRGEVPAERNPITFLCYILFFPQLIAGPIVRFRDVREQLSQLPTRRWLAFTDGLPRFFWGLAKKVLIADQAGQIADAAFGIAGYQITVADTVIGVLAYSIQIYFDFSGYSDMAIGLSRMFGITFPENFNRPYSASSVTDFWRRWHISLSTWFRDYVYIPLGGNRLGSGLLYRNLLIVFVLTGFWHGANWTFLAWGLVHGAALIGERLTIRSRDLCGAVWAISLRLWTLLVVAFGWLLFRSDDLSHAGELLSALGGGNGFAPSAVVDASLTPQRILWTGIGALIFLMPARRSVGETLTSVDPRPALQFVAVTAGLLASLYVMSSSFSPFLYFQF